MMKQFIQYNRKWHYGPIALILAFGMVFVILEIGWLVKRYGNIDYGSFKKGVNRQVIADRIIAQGSLAGLSKLDVELLLGKDENITPVQGCAYYIGQERSFISIDAEILLVIIVGGMVVECRIVSM